jgi:argininosuccinate lyase
MPLGSGALAGSPLAIDREKLARALGFSRISQNSLDAVSDRDFVAELLFVFALIASHLSRLAEDWILYSGSEFGWLIMGDAYATGSSLMPQKKNPDALELIRGKAGRQIGNLTRLLVVLKGLPLAYNRDLQEDKEAMFDSLETAMSCLRIAGGVVSTTSVNRARAAEAVNDCALLATDLADLLVEAGVAFHDAHQIVGKIVSACVRDSRDFRQFSAEELKRFAPQLDQAKVAQLTPARSVARRRSIGGTAIEQVKRQAERVKAEAGKIANLVSRQRE